VGAFAEENLSNSSLVGAILADRYEIVCEVGRGALGVVYMARHLVMEKTVAVKVLFGEVQKDETNFLRFQREAQAASSMSHPNIVVVYDFGISQNQTPFLVMDFVEGTNLKDISPAPRQAPNSKSCSNLLTNGFSSRARSLKGNSAPRYQTRKRGFDAHSLESRVRQTS
jgi:serine/threonine protein kinase